MRPISLFSGTIQLNEALSTPGSCCTRSSTWWKKALFRDCSLYLVQLRLTCMERTLVVLKPGSTESRGSRLRSMRPAHMSRTNESVTWAPTSRLRRRVPLWLPAVRSPASVRLVMRTRLAM